MHFALWSILILCLVSCATRPPQPLSSLSTSQKIIPTIRPYKVNGHIYYPLPSAKGYVEEGLASWYGPGFHGQRTASGERYNMYAFTAAHKLLPLNSHVLVINLENGRKTIVRINDRGPFVKDRIIDLSYAAAKALGMTKEGVVRVRIIALGEAHYQGNQLMFIQGKDLMRGRFFLQVAAFRNYAQAVRLRGKLCKKFRYVHIEPYKREGVTFFRVQVYLSNNLRKAQELYAELRKLYPESILVAK